jgi:rhodanese-related sulfurtransferase
MKPREFKDKVFEQFARIAHALASPKRLEIVDVLAQGERSVEVLAGETGLSLANASRHLQVLRGARLVEARKERVRVIYRLSDPMVFQCWKGLQALAESRLTEVDAAVRAYFHARDGMEPLARDVLMRRARDGAVVVLDVRPVEEYESGHIAGALSIPLAQLRDRLDEIPADREVVAYCRGPYCVLAVEAVALLRRSGRSAVRLQDGFPEWRQQGLPVLGTH